MQFRPNNETKPFDYFLSQPHQPFFLTGIVWAIITMLLFMLGHKGVLPMAVDASLFHAYAMLFIVFSHFFHGFLLTTFPRFCMTRPVPVALYTRIFILYEIGTTLFLLGAVGYAPVALIGILAVFAGHLLAVSGFRLIYLTGASPEKSDPFWLLIAHAMGIAAHLIFIVGVTYGLFGYDFPWQPWGVGMGVYLYLFFLTFVVAQRMVPFFSHVMADKPNRFIPIVLSLFGLKALLFALGFPVIEGAVTLALSLYLAKTLLSWRLPVFDSPAILWVLHLGLFWLPVGLFIDAVLKFAAAWLQTSFLFGGMHLVALGFMTTILIGFGTRVTLGHSGQVPHADRFSTALFWFTQVVVLARFFYSLALGLGLDMAWLFDLAATLWLLLFLAWGIKFGPTLFRGAPGR
ncbi:NnrS family protein [Hydrogenimonas sp. SS33]|uniref:NnrS family protein n=1 Tax=Hydrogenimonas leucolamina TaxID=2954236 RepID=UPI00336BE007